MAQSQNPLARFSQQFGFELAKIRFWQLAAFEPKEKSFGATKSAPMYFADAIVPKDHPEYGKLWDVLDEIAANAFPDTDPDDVSWPLRDGDEVMAKAKAQDKDYPFLANTSILSATSTLFVPKMSIVSGGKVEVLTGEARALNSGKFYSGVEGTLVVNFVPWKGNNAARNPIPNSIKAYLQEVCSLGTGAPLGGTGSGVSNFAKNIGAVTQENVASMRGRTRPGQQINDPIPF